MFTEWQGLPGRAARGKLHLPAQAGKGRFKAPGGRFKPQNDISECGSWKIEEKTKTKGNSN